MGDRDSQGILLIFFSRTVQDLSVLNGDSLTLANKQLLAEFQITPSFKLWTLREGEKGKKGGRGEWGEGEGNVLDRKFWPTNCGKIQVCWSSQLYLVIESNYLDSKWRNASAFKTLQFGKES